MTIQCTLSTIIVFADLDSKLVNGPVSRLVTDGHCHKVLVADGDDTIEVCVPCPEGICQGPQHHACLDEVIKFEAFLRQPIKPRDNQLAESHAHSKTHLIVGSVELIEVNIAGAIPIVTIKDSFPLVDVLPELLKLTHINGTTVVTIKQTCDIPWSCDITCLMYNRWGCGGIKFGGSAPSITGRGEGLAHQTMETHAHIIYTYH